MSRSVSPIRGINDILPDQTPAWQWLEHVVGETLQAYGYREIRLPIMERTELFARSIGEVTDIVEKEMYTFEDRSGDSLSLRPEATASCVRAGITHGLFHNQQQRLWYSGPMFRYERPQKGRNRQFHQAGVEYLGSASAEADVEVIEFGWRYLEELGLSSVELRLNSIGDPADRATYDEQIRRFLDERREALSDDARRRVDTNPMRVLDSKADAAIIADAPVPLDHIGSPARSHFEEVRAGLDHLGIPYVLAPRLVRGLDYYNRTVWEYVPTDYDAAQSSVGGGGRYDGLFEVLGGRATPAVGLAMGIDRIRLAAPPRGVEVALDIFVVVVNDDDRATARRLVSDLRSDGLRVDMTDRPRPMKAQFKEADRRGAGHAVIVGDEWRDGSVTIKDLALGDQDVISNKEIAPWLRSR